MAKQLNFIPEIKTGNTIEAYHVMQFVEAFNGIDQYDIKIDGSLEVDGTVLINGDNGNTITISPDGSILANGLEITDYNGGNGKLVVTLEYLNQALINSISNITLGEDVITNTQAGAISPQTTLPSSTTFLEFVKTLTIQTFYPNLTNTPTFGITNGLGTLAIIGSTHNILITLSYNPGSIQGDLVGGIWSPNTQQNDLAGTPTYTPGQSSINNSYIIQLGNNNFTGSIDYAEGPQPLDSIGQPYQSPYPAGSSGTLTTTIEGVYPLYATTQNITTLTQQSLKSMSTSTFEINLVAETSTDRYKLQIPDDWGGNLSSIEEFNTVSGNYDGGNSISSWDQTSTNITVSGNTVGYQQYEKTGPTQGAIKLRLTF